MNLALFVLPLVAVPIMMGKSFRSARWWTAAVLGVELILGLCFGLFGAHSEVWMSWKPSTVVPYGPALAAAVALVAAVMVPARDGHRRFFVQILLMTSAAALVTGFSDLRLLALGWVLHMLPFGWEVWRTPARRVFTAHMAISAVSVVIGAAAMLTGHTTVGFWALAVGIGIREAVLPAHAWLVNVLRHAPPALVIVFVAPQLGIAAHLELLSGAPPPGFVSVLATAAAATALGGALLGVFQADARKALAYLLVSQSGLVAFGLEAHSEVGQAGAILVWVTSSVAFAGFAMILAAVEARRGRLTVDRPSGNFDRIPRLASAWLFLGLACVGLPGTVGFIAEDLLVEGTVEAFPLLAMVIVLTTAINGIAVLRIFFGVFTGSRQHTGEQDMLPRERWMSSAVMALLIVLGLAPGIVSKALSTPQLAAAAHDTTISLQTPQDSPGGPTAPRSSKGARTWQ